MDDPLLVRGCQAMRDLQRIVDRFSLRQLPTRQRLAKRLALEQLLHDIGSAFVGPDVVDGGYVGMVEDSGGFGFSLESTQAVRVLRERGGQNLDGDVAAQPRILRPVYLPHP